MAPAYASEESRPLPSSPPSRPALFPQLLATVTGGLIAMVVGTTLSLPPSLIPQLVEEGMAKDLASASCIATAYLYAAVPACLCGGLLSDWLGRRKIVLLCCPLLLLGYIVLPLSHSLTWLVSARLVTALGAWLAYPSANALVTEFVHPTVRGSLGSFTFLFLAIGMLQSYALGYLLPWRTMAFVLSYQPPLLLLCLLLLPESPRWLALYGRHQEASDSLSWARGPAWPLGTELEEMLTSTRQRLPELSINLVRRLATLKSTVFRLSLCLASSISLFGISTMKIFMAPVFKDSGLTPDPRLAPVIIGSMQVFTSCCSSAALNQANRRYMFASCSLLLDFCCAAMAAFSHWRDTLLPIHLGIMPLVIAILIFVAHLCLGAFIINGIHLIMAEMFPGRVPSLGSSLNLTIAILGNALSSSLYPIVQGATDFYVFAFSFVASLFMAILAVLVIPDHRDLRLD